PVAEDADDHEPFKFRITAIDRQNNSCQFELPLLWVNRELAETTGDPSYRKMFDQIVERYACEVKKRSAPLHAQKIALVPKREPRENHTTATATAESFDRDEFGKVNDNAFTVEEIVLRVDEEPEPTEANWQPVQWRDEHDEVVPTRGKLAGEFYPAH